MTNSHRKNQERVRISNPMPTEIHQPILKVHLKLENPTDRLQSVFLERGRCFEITDPDLGLQNAALAEDVELAIPPRQTVEVQIPAFCLNRYRQMTGRQDAFLTDYVIDDTCSDQQRVWRKVEKPAA